jgi:hypothetical protein
MVRNFTEILIFLVNFTPVLLTRGLIVDGGSAAKRFFSSQQLNKLSLVDKCKKIFTRPMRVQ